MEEDLAVAEVLSTVSVEEDNTLKGLVVSSIKEEAISSIKDEHWVASLEVVEHGVRIEVEHGVLQVQETGDRQTQETVTGAKDNLIQSMAKDTSTGILREKSIVTLVGVRLCLSEVLQQ